MAAYVFFTGILAVTVAPMSVLYFNQIQMKEDLYELKKKNQSIEKLVEERTLEIKRILLEKFEPEKYDNPVGSLAALAAPGPAE